jgi:hypothetical protein
MARKKVKYVSELTVSDWVTIEQRGDIYKGYVLNSNGEKFTFFCTSKKETKDKEFITINRNYGSFRIDSGAYDLYLELTAFDEMDKKVLIDIALDTGDKDWFEELVG